MKRERILARQSKLSDITFDEFYDNISQDWEYRAKRLQARRWRVLAERGMEGGFE